MLKCTAVKYWFDCAEGHEFETRLSNVTRLNSWCPKCKHKGEKKLFDVFNPHHNLQHGFPVNWCKNYITNRKLPFDFLVLNKPIIIELDGIQHFKQVRDWNPPEEQQINDNYKMQRANENGYSVIRLLQEDVLYDRIDWVQHLLNTIDKITTEKIVQNVYICENDEYEVYK